MACSWPAAPRSPTSWAPRPKATRCKPRPGYYLEIEAVIHGSTGSVKVCKNGVQVISATGVNTKGQSQDGVSTLRLRMPGTTAWAACNVDDVYVADAATRLGDSRVITLVPDGDTGDKDWSPSSGEDNYAMVDEEQVDGDTSYVASSTPGDLDFYTMGNLGCHAGHDPRGAAR